MKKIVNMVKVNKGIIIFYTIVAILSLMLTETIEEVNTNTENKIVEQESYYA